MDRQMDWAFSSIASEVESFLNEDDDSELDFDLEEDDLCGEERKLGFDPSLKVEASDKQAINLMLRSVQLMKEDWIEQDVERQEELEQKRQPQNLTHLSVEDIMELHKRLLKQQEERLLHFRPLRKWIQRLVKWQEAHSPVLVRVKDLCKNLKHRALFKAFFWTLIFVNVSLIVMVANAEVESLLYSEDSADFAAFQDLRDFSDRADMVFLVFYTFEVLVRALGVNKASELADGFLFMDTVLVASGFTDIVLTEVLNSSGDNPLVALRAVRLFRVARIMKVLRLMDVARPFRVLIRALKSCLIDLLWVVAFLFIFNYAAAAFFTQTVGWIPDDARVAAGFLGIDMEENSSALLRSNSEIAYSFYFKDTMRSVVTISGISLNGFAFGEKLMEGSIQNPEWSLTSKAFLIFYIVVVILWHLDITRGVFISDLLQCAGADSSYVAGEKDKESGHAMKALNDEIFEYAQRISDKRKLHLDEFKYVILRSKHNDKLQISELGIENMFIGLDYDHKDQVDIDEFVIGLFKHACPSYNEGMMYIDSMTLRTCQDVASMLGRYKAELKVVKDAVKSLSCAEDKEKEEAWAYLFSACKNTVAAMKAHRLFAAPALHFGKMKRYIADGSRLFLLDASSKRVLGPFFAVGEPYMDIAHHAFAGGFKAQVRFKLAGGRTTLREFSIENAEQEFRREFAIGAIRPEMVPILHNKLEQGKELHIDEFNSWMQGEMAASPQRLPVQIAESTSSILEQLKSHVQERADMMGKEGSFYPDGSRSIAMLLQRGVSGGGQPQLRSSATVSFGGFGGGTVVETTRSSMTKAPTSVNFRYWLPSESALASRLEGKFGFKSRWIEILEKLDRNVEEVSSPVGASSQFGSPRMLLSSLSGSPRRVASYTSPWRTPMASAMKGLPSFTSTATMGRQSSDEKRRHQAFQDLLETEALPWLRQRMRSYVQHEMDELNTSKADAGDGHWLSTTPSMAASTGQQTQRGQPRASPKAKVRQPREPTASSIPSFLGPQTASLTLLQTREEPRYSPRDYPSPSRTRGYSSLSRALMPAESKMGRWQPTASSSARQHQRLEAFSEEKQQSREGLQADFESERVSFV